MQAAPANCMAAAQLGCARLPLHRRTPSVVVLTSDGIATAPATVALGEEATRSVGYRNVGEAAAASNVCAPAAYFEHRGLLSSTLAATCSSQGSLAACQIVCRCQRSA